MGGASALRGHPEPAGPLLCLQMGISVGRSLPVAETLRFRTPRNQVQRVTLTGLLGATSTTGTWVAPSDLMAHPLSPGWHTHTRPGARVSFALHVSNLDSSPHPNTLPALDRFKLKSRVDAAFVSGYPVFPFASLPCDQGQE